MTSGQLSTIFTCVEGRTRCEVVLEEAVDADIATAVEAVAIWVVRAKPTRASSPAIRDIS